MDPFIVTDTHLGHEKMVEYCGRPENHTEIVLEEFKYLDPGDILIHLGDICIGQDSKWHEELNKAIDPGVLRILVRGNHDHKNEQWYLTHGWNVVFTETGFIGQFFNKKIWFSHAPHAKNGEADFNVHGHLHNNEHRMDDETKKIYNKSYHRLLAIENTGLAPVRLSKLLGIDKQ